MMWAVWVTLALCMGPGALGGPRAEVPALRVWAPAAYRAESSVQLNEAQRKDKALGYEVRSSLRVAPLWRLGPECLLQLRVVAPRLFLRGAHVLADHIPYESVWDRYPDTSFYVHWREGRVLRLYLDPDEPLDVRNYKRSLASLFQVGALDGAYNETDAGGRCAVLYETLSSAALRKVKTHCAGDGPAVAEGRRAVRYELGGALDELQRVFADELLLLGAPPLGLKARSWVRLTRSDERVPAPPPLPDLQAALSSLPARLVPHALELDLPPDLHHYLEEPLQHQELARSLLELSAALDEAGGGEEEGGDERGVARAALLVGPVVRAVRGMDATQLGALAAHPELTPHLATLCRALGLAGTLAAHEAAARLLQLEGVEPLRALALDYLGALAVSASPDEAAVRAALRLGEAARDKRVGRAALLAAGGAAPHVEGGAALVDEVRHSLVRALSRCQEEECYSSLAGALGNTGRADTVELLLQQAERGVTAALDALHALPLSFAHLDRLDALALNGSAPLEVRAAALDLLVVRRAPLPAPLARTAHALHAAGPDPAAHELRRVLWQRVAELAPEHAELRRLPRLLPAELRGWDALAHAGTSHVLSRAPGWALGGWRARLDSLQVARGGVLRRGAVVLRAHRGGDVRDVLGVRLWARGLHALAGDHDEAAPAEEAAAGLALDVAGVRLPELPLFSGQAELLGHVWAGTASTPTPALRTLVPMRERRGVVRLAGGAALAVLAEGAAALALDAQAQASLWYRSAHTRLELRAGAALEVRAALRVAWGEAAARAAVSAGPRLHIDADLDFYSGVALCVRAHCGPQLERRVVRAHSVAGARRLRVSRVARAVTRREGATLALGRPNDQVCRTLRAQHH